MKKGINYLLLAFLAMVTVSCNEQGSTTSETISVEQNNSEVVSMTSEETSISEEVSVSIEEPVSTEIISEESTSVEDVVTCSLVTDVETSLEKGAPGAKLYKFSGQLDLDADTQFMVKLSVNGDITQYGYDQLGEVNNLTENTYDEPFFVLGDEGKIKTVLDGAYTVYVVIEQNRTASINIDVRDFEVPVIPYREAYLVGEGSFNSGEGVWSTTTGVQGTEMHDNPTAKEKYSFNVDLTKNDKFMFTLKDTSIWFGYSAIKGITNKTENTEYSVIGDFFTKNDSNNIIAQFSGNYTFYLSVWQNDTADIWVDVENFEIPNNEQVIIVSTEGLTNELTFGEVTFDPEWETFKFDKYSTFTSGDEFKIKVSIDGVETYVGYSHIEGHGGDITDLPDNFITSGEGNTIKLAYDAGITFVVTGKTNGTIAIWYNVYSVTIPSKPSMNPGCYVEGLWGQNANKDASQDAPNAEQNIVHKYEAYGFFYQNDILTVKIADETTVYEFFFKDIVAQNRGNDSLPEGNFLCASEDGKIQVMKNCDFTLYLEVYSNNTVAIYATVWNYYN